MDQNGFLFSRNNTRQHNQIQSVIFFVFSKLKKVNNSNDMMNTFISEFIVV